MNGFDATFGSRRGVSGSAQPVPLALSAQTPIGLRTLTVDGRGLTIAAGAGPDASATIRDLTPLAGPVAAAVAGDGDARHEWSEGDILAFFALNSYGDDGRPRFGLLLEPPGDHLHFGFEPADLALLHITLKGLTAPAGQVK